MHDLIIVGAGPAGLAAAMYAIRKRLDFLLVSPDIGGKSNYSLSIEDGDSTETVRAAELVTLYRTRVESLRHSIAKGSVDRIERLGHGFSVEANGELHEGRAVIIATGTRLSSLGAEGESEFRARGLGYSSISYSHLFQGKRVFLCGDSDRVLNAAIEMSVQTASVTVALLEGATPGSEPLARLDDLERVTVYRNARVTSFAGDEFARSVSLTVDGSSRSIEADGFFIELEPTPNTGFLADLGVLDSNGYVQVDGHDATNIPGLYAAGDVTGNGFEQVLVSLGDGAKAVLSAYRYLLGVGITGR